MRGGTLQSGAENGTGAMVSTPYTGWVKRHLQAALALAAVAALPACGQAVSADADRSDIDATDAQGTLDPDTVPPALAAPLPPGGTSVARVTGPLSQLVATQSGVLWLLSSCEGLYALSGSEIRRYTGFDSVLPEQIYDVRVDAQDRLWVYGASSDDGFSATLTIAEDGEWHSGLASGVSQFSVNADGTAWIVTTDAEDQRFARPVLPELGALVPLPERSSSIAAGPSGSFWLGADDGIYRWSAGSWVGPAGPTETSSLLYDPRRDVLVADGASPVTVSWTGTSIEARPLSRPAGASLLGIDESGREVALDEQRLVWLRDGVVVESLDVERQAQIALAPGSGVYVASAGHVSRYRDGLEEPVLELFAFDERTAFPWRGLSYDRVLAAPSIDATDEDVRAAATELQGTKIHVRGRAVSGFEMSALEMDGSTVPSTWLASARELRDFYEQVGLELHQPIAEPPAAVADAVDWDLYGYLETGTCFGHLGGNRRQFWVVEGYPTSLQPARRQELESELRARYPGQTEP
jgi:hypothetical protein